MSALECAYKEGYEYRFRNGAARMFCLYDRLSEAYSAWIRGYFDCEYVLEGA